MNQKALALPALLICISFAFLLTLPLTAKSIKILRYFAEEKITSDLIYLIKSKLLAKNFYKKLVSPAGSQMDCLSEEASRSGYVYNLSFCTLYFKQYSLELPILAFTNARLDYDRLRAKLNDCSTEAQILDKDYLISSGHFSNLNCLLESYKQKITQVQRNLIVTDRLSISNSDFLSVNGFIHANKLHFENQSAFILFAVGEIIVDSLDTKQEMDLQIISASGNIRIKQVDKNIRLTVFSQKEISLPAGTANPEQEIKKYSLSKLALGFSLQD